MNKPLYEKDFFAWTQAQADALRRRSANELDWDNLVEEIDSMGRQQRSELHSHFVILIQHLLKWRHQPARRSRSWRLRVEEQRREIEALIGDNPSLSPDLQALFDRAYTVARISALRETRLPDKKIPVANPFGLAEAMTGPLEDQRSAEDAAGPEDFGALVVSVGDGPQGFGAAARAMRAAFSRLTPSQQPYGKLGP
jgi:hypothetical protein